MAVKSTPTKHTHTTDDLAALIAELRQDMQIVREDFKAFTGAARGAAKEEFGSLKEGARESARAALSKSEAAAHALSKDAKKQLASVEKTVEAQASEHPWRTLGLVGLGAFALGLLIRR